MRIGTRLPLIAAVLAAAGDMGGGAPARNLGVKLSPEQRRQRTEDYETRGPLLLTKAEAKRARRRERNQHARNGGRR